MTSATNDDGFNSIQTFMNISVDLFYKKDGAAFSKRRFFSW